MGVILKKRLVKILSIVLVAATLLMGCANKTEEASLSDVNAESSANCDSSSQGNDAGAQEDAEAADKDNTSSGEEAVNYKVDR